MPELPEVEILADEMNHKVKGKEIQGFIIDRERNPDFPIDAFHRTINNTKIKNTSRKGKMLLIELSNHHCLLIHLMLVGQVILTQRTDYNAKSTELILNLDNNWHLWIVGVALKYIQFGTCDEIENLPALKKLGIDPLDKRFTLALFKEKLARKKGIIKSVLLNQSLIAGIGNTYVDELLFAAGIKPDRSVSSLTEKEVAKIFHSITHVLQEGIRWGGASDIAFVHLDGSKGSFQEHFNVNRRKGKPCPVCGHKIEKTMLSGRGTYFCPQCQK